MISRNIGSNKAKKQIVEAITVKNTILMLIGKFCNLAMQRLSYKTTEKF